MLLKVNGVFLDLSKDDPGPDVEKQSRLFERIDETAGDFSYTISLPTTQHNIETLGLQSVDISTKIIYKNMPCEITDEDGLPTYIGNFRVQRKNKTSIECSFFSGNYNWMNKLTGNVNDLDFSEYDIELTDSNIVNSTVNTEGLVFPILDAGALKTRSYQSMMVEDFNACMYVKTIMNKIFWTAGIKIKGDLLNDFIYKNAVVACNTKSDESIEARSSYAKKTSNQTVVDLAAYTVILFQDDSTFPYYDGSENNYSTSTYRFTADVKMSIKVEVNLVISMNTQLNRQFYRINKNGATYREYVNRFGPGATPPENYSFQVTMPMEAGDYIQIDVKSVDSIGVNTGVQTGSTFKVTPVYLYTVLGDSSVPRWTKQQFVSNILNLFDVISDYNPVSNEVTFDLFEKINTKSPIDISNYIDSVESDYEDFISNFSKNNILSYSEGDNEDITKYNVDNKVKYASGIITVDNDFIGEEATMIQSDFIAPKSYINGALDSSIEQLNLITVSEGESTDFTAVADSATFAEFTISDDIFEAGDLVRVSESSNAAYNGDWVVVSTGGGQLFLRWLSFSVNATGKVTKLNYSYNNNSDVYILINIPNYTLSSYSSVDRIYIGSNGYTNLSLSYFNLLNTGLTVNTEYKQGLCFGPVNNPLFYQRNLIDTYWRKTGQILNDPVKVPCVAYLPKSVFLSLTPLTPVYMKTMESTGQYYINRITGYKNSYSPCVIELIKL